MKPVTARRFLWLCATSMPSAVLASLTLALVAGFCVMRALAAYWGLPDGSHFFSYHPDEPFVLLPALRVAATGDWNPHFFNYGTLYIYLVDFVGLLSGTAQEAARSHSDLRPLYLTGRFITVWMSYGTIALLWISLKRFGDRLRNFAVLLLAICPLHLVSSAYATVDVPATFWLTLAFVLTILGVERPKAVWCALTGVSIGLAAATKYNAALFLLPAMLAPHLIGLRPKRWTWYPCIVGGAIVGFVIGCPLFYTEEFRRGFLFELNHARIGGTLAFVSTGNGWAYHLFHGLPVGLGYPLLASAFLGVAAAVRTRCLHARLSLAWVVFYILAIGFSKERFIRYLIPLTPFLAILAAMGWQALYRKWSYPSLRALVAILATATVMLTSIYASHQFHALERDPRDLAGDRLSEMADRTPTLRAGLVSPPWYFNPAVSPYNGGPFPPGAFDDWNRRNGNRVAITGWDAAKLRAEKPEVFFLSDLESQDLLRLKRPDALAFVAALDRFYEGRHTVARRESAPAWLAPPRSWAPPDWLYQSPVITMYYNPR